MLPLIGNEGLIMIKKLEYYLCKAGYKKLSVATTDFSVFFTLETGYVNAVIFVDLVYNSSITRESLREFKDKIAWRFLDSGSRETHILSVFLTNDIGCIDDISLGDRFEWVLLEKENRLLIGEGKAEDFYGLKRLLERTLSENVEVDPAWLMPMECDVKGNPYFSSVLQRPLVNHGLFILNLLLFSGCILSGNLLYDWGSLSYQQVMDGDYYRIFSSMFLHADMQHIVGNMLILYYMGNIVERALGHIRYLCLYLLSGVAAAFASMSYAYLTGQYISSVGASGAIFGVVGALLWIAIRNHGHIEIMSVKKILFLIGYSLYSGLISTNVDNAAHVGGVFAGFVLAILLYHNVGGKRKKFHVSHSHKEV